MTIRWDAIRDLIHVVMDCASPNWDCYGANPVSEESAQSAANVLASLPPSIPDPSFGADPDGDVTLDWHAGNRTLSFSVSPTGSIAWASLIEGASQCGAEQFSGALSETLLDLIAQVYQ